MREQPFRQKVRKYMNKRYPDWIVATSNTASIPDYTVHTDTGTFFIEFKGEGGSLSNRQVLGIEQLNKLGYGVLVLNADDDYQYELYHYIRIRKEEK